MEPAKQQLQVRAVNNVEKEKVVPAAAAGVVAAESAKVGGESKVELQDEKLRKKRNRDEIGSFYKAYRRVRMCLTRQDDSTRFGGKRHDLEAAYHSMLDLSYGESSPLH